MSKAKSIKGTTQNWESGKLGSDIEHAKPAGAKLEAALEAALEMKLISIRLPVPLINQLKIIAKYHAIGYQPMMRDVLTRFAGHEMIDIMRQLEAQEIVEHTLSDADSPAARHMKDCA